jgi:hypothetical protein
VEFLQLSGCTVEGPHRSIDLPGLLWLLGKATALGAQSGRGRGQGWKGKSNALENKPKAKVSRKDNQTLHLLWLCVRFIGTCVRVRKGQPLFMFWT